MKCKKYNLLKTNEYGKYFKQYNQIVIDVLRKQQLTFSQFSRLIFEEWTIHQPGLSYINLVGCRNRIIQSIFGYQPLSMKLFERIMIKILNEQLDEERIKQLILIGNGDDLREQRFGRLVVKECVNKTSSYKLQWRCLCDCNNETIVQSGSLKTGHTTSCGCYHLECVTKHGMHCSREYRTWSGMLARCTNKHYKHYHNYGGRGIIVCDRWRHSFENFYEDMGDRPEGMTIDRRENDGNYEPNNCRWATQEEQCYNKRTTPKFEDGTSVGLWSITNNIDYDKSNDLFHKGFTKKEILNKLSSKEIST